MFGFIKRTLSNIYNQFTSKITGLFHLKKIDSGIIAELEKILLSADTGTVITNNIINKIKQEYKKNNITSGTDLKLFLEKELKDILNKNNYIADANVYLLVGINGSGKTTFVGKLANYFKTQNKKVLIVAADTFRAAAAEQLLQIAKKIDIDIVTGGTNQDPSSVVYIGCQKYKNENYDILIIDTAGRLQTKVNLMKELQKIKNTINKQLEGKINNFKLSVLLTIDSMLGQNSIEQAKIFNECIKVNGIVLTKLDGTAKGGVIFYVTSILNIPVGFISYGENINEIKLFNSQEFVNDMLYN